VVVDRRVLAKPDGWTKSLRFFNMEVMTSKTQTWNLSMYILVPYKMINMYLRLCLETSKGIAREKRKSGRVSKCLKVLLAIKLIPNSRTK
jgi:hypothetical protein